MCTWQPLLFSGGLQAAAACQRKMPFSLSFLFEPIKSLLTRVKRHLKAKVPHTLIKTLVTLLEKVNKAESQTPKHFVLFKFESFTFHRTAVVVSVFLTTRAFTNQGSETEDPWGTARKKKSHLTFKCSMFYDFLCLLWLLMSHFNNDWVLTAADHKIVREPVSRLPQLCVCVRGCVCPVTIFVTWSCFHLFWHVPLPVL